jgi:hypothetical protein
MRLGRASCSQTAGAQIELPLSVPVCAWCKPDTGRGLNAALISHGICARHLKELKMSLNPPAAGSAKAPPRPSRRKHRIEGEVLLPLVF